MRIAYFTEVLPPFVDGVTHTLSHLKTSLADEGHDFIFLSPTVPEIDGWKNKVVPVISIPFPLYTKYRMGLPAFHDIKSTLDKFKPDIVHIVSPFFMGMAAYNYAKGIGIPAVNSYHTRFVSYLKYYGFSKIEWFGWDYLRWFYNKAARTFVPSTATINELEEHGFKRLSLWQRGIDTSKFSPLFADRGLHDHWSPGGSPIALYTGRLVREKDIETLIQAYKILESRRVDFKLVFVGSGPLKEELAAALPNAILAGFMKGDELSRAYASADLFVFPSTTESFGNVVLEAQASGLPCIVAAEGGVMDLVQDGQNGFLTQPKNVENLAAKMEILLTNEILRNSFSIKAQEYASQKSWKEVNRSLFRGYEELINNKGMENEEDSLTLVPEQTLFGTPKA
ncbi:MAG TPA: glycosyltransferase family 1 protein [candidate division Zixibacteria bacterium]|nr:glycosyltransferase family 1 protein [candidate division Zixibacteria bacterium]HBZ00743.1 glycosyltransferase family 1 protein [candidate division Zixibacteria bacterium]